VLRVACVAWARRYELAVRHLGSDDGKHDSEALVEPLLRLGKAYLENGQFDTAVGFLQVRAWLLNTIM